MAATLTQSSSAGVAVAHVCFSWPEAEVAASMLNAAGIPAIVGDRLTVANDFHMSMAFGGFRILVPRESLDEAQNLLKEVEPSNQTMDSDAFKKAPLAGSFWLAVSLLFEWCPAWLRKK
jgi:hypothetical protein